MNQIIISGRLTRDPEIRVTQGTGTKVATYSLAVDRRTKDGGVDFIQCVAFSKGADFVEKYLTKGIKILVTGTLQIDEYTDREGNKKKAAKVIVNQHEFCESKNAASSNANTYGEEVHPGQYVPRDGFAPVSPEDVQEALDSSVDLPF